MKRKITSLAIIFAFILSALPISAGATSSYTDVPTTHWAYDVITKWSGDGYGVLEGVGNGNFRPSSGISIGELAAILTRTFGYTEREAADVTPEWAAEYVKKAIAAGVIEQADRIDANTTVTREQAIRYIAIAYNIGPVMGETSFSDNNRIGAQYKPYVAAFQKLGYIQGKPGNMFDPQAVYTRAEAMQVIENSTNDIIDQSIDDKDYANNLIVRTQGLTISNTIVRGNLIIGQGVGDGEVTLDNVTVLGKLVINGGGSNSILITGGSQIRYAVFNKQGSEPANIRVDSGSTVTAAEIYAGSGAIISGNVAEVMVSANVTLEIAEGSIVQSITMNGENVEITVREGGNVLVIKIEGDNVTIAGLGRVETVEVGAGAAGATVSTRGTTIVNNGAGSVATNNGAIGEGETGSTSPQTTVRTGRGGFGGGGSSDPAVATVYSIGELQNALENDVVKTIYIVDNLVNSSAEIVVPQDKTLVISTNASLQIRSLDIEGTVTGSDNAVLNVGTTPSGNIKNDTSGGFFCISTEEKPVAYRTYIWRWISSNYLGDEVTGWWPSGVVVATQSSLSEAIELDTLRTIVFEFDIEIEKSFNVDYIRINDCDIVIPTGITVTTNQVVMALGSLTIDGMLIGSSELYIYMYGDSILDLNGMIYHGPDEEFFQLGGVARTLYWEKDTGWSTPRLYNMNTGQWGTLYTSLRTLDDISYLANRYPGELAGVHIYGLGISNSLTFSYDFTFSETALALLIHGNQTFYYGDTSNIVDPVLIESGVTVVFSAETRTIMVVDNPNLNAIEGIDTSSRIIVEVGANVINSYQDGDNEPKEWEPGTYIWTTNGWEKQP